MTIKSEFSIAKQQKNIEKYAPYMQKLNKIGSEIINNSTKARARLNALIDPNSYFFELSQMAGYQLYDGIHDAGIITGIGLVDNKPCMILINNSENKAGCYTPITIKKTIRALEIAIKQKLPCLHLVDSGGAYLPMQADLFANADGFGRIFYLQAQLTKHKIPQYAAILGSCTAGGAYIPVMTDACTMVKNKASLFLAGPPLVEAATGEKLTAQALGGSSVHCYQSKVVHHESESETAAINWLRQAITRTKHAKIQGNSYQQPKTKNNLTGFIEADSRHLPDIQGIIENLVDGSKFTEFQGNQGSSLRTGYAKIHGKDIALIANDGILTTESMIKAKKFIELAEISNTPLVILHNTHGMLVGSAAEKSGIATAGANLIRLIAMTDLKKYTIMLGNSYGAGNYAMAGRAFEPDFLLQWPNNKIAVMGAKQQEFVLNKLGKDMKIDASTHTAFVNSAKLHDDGIIDPNQTRKILGFLLNIV